MSVKDGRTITVAVGDQKLQFYLAYVAEPTQVFRNESQGNLKNLTFGKQVTIIRISTSEQPVLNGALPAKVMLVKNDVALMQLSAGLVWFTPWTAGQLSPEERGEYLLAENSAKKGEKGVWRRTYSECKDAPVKTDIDISAEGALNEKYQLKVVGTARVEMIIGEDGVVKSARAICGHPILQTQAVEKALQWRFKGTGQNIVGPMTFLFHNH